MTDIAAYEPAIVTTLRRYMTRGASRSLLHRLAGGARDWRLLNEWWNIDGVPRRPPPERTVDPRVLAMSVCERRIALVQLADDYGEARAAFPRHGDLAEAFGVSLSQINHDLCALRSSGRIASRLAMEGADAD